MVIDTVAFEEFPHITKQEMIKGPNVIFENGFGSHVGADVEVIDTIQRIQLHRVCLEVAWQKGGADAIITRTGSYSLHIIEEDCDVWHLR